MLQYLKIFSFLIALIPALISCENKKKVKPPVKATVKSEKKEILLQPFSDLPIEKAEYVYKKIREIGLNTKLLPAIQLPSLAYYKPRNRYRADSLIDWLRNRVSGNQVIAGITSKDISTTKGSNPDSGVFGIGFMNGPTCMVSSFRLHSNEQLYKVTVHELGHNFGLEHCPEKTCFMRDAKGKNPLNEEKEFCPSCKGILITKGWKL